MNQKGFANIALIVLLVLVLGGGAGYVVLTRNQQPAPTTEQLPTPSPITTKTPTPQTPSPQQTPPPTVTQAPTPQAPTPTPTATEETANWKTYRNEQYGFEVKYPSEAQEIKDKKLPGENILLALNLAPSKTAEIGTVNILNCYYSPLGQSVMKKKNVSVNGSNFCLNVEEDSGTGGQKARDYYYTTKKGNEYLLMSFHVIYNSYCGKYPEYNCAKFNETKETSIFNQILSTFRFTQ